MTSPESVAFDRYDAFRRAEEPEDQLDQLLAGLADVEQALDAARESLEGAEARHRAAGAMLERLEAEGAATHRLFYERLGLFSSRGACLCGWRGNRYPAPLGWPAMDAEYRDHLGALGY